MSLTQPPADPPNPPAAPSRNDERETFDLKANAMAAWYAPMIAWFTSFVTWARTFATQLDTLQNDVSTDTNTAVLAAGTATAKRNEAVAARDTAVSNADISTQARADTLTAKADTYTARDLTFGYRQGAQNAQTAAEAARDTAQIYATQQFTASSTTSRTNEVGSNKTFTIETGKGFVAGQYVVIPLATDYTVQMRGYIRSYDKATGALSVDVDFAQGAVGPFANWRVAISLPANAAGLTTVILAAGQAVNAVPNVRYIVTGASVAITFVAADWTAGKFFDIVENIGNGTIYTINFNGMKFRGADNGSTNVPASRSRLQGEYFDSTRGFI